MGLFNKDSKLNILGKASRKASDDIDVMLKSGESISTIAKLLRRKYIMQIILISVVTVVLATASFAYISAAWFANNKEVSADNSTVNVDEGPASLFIQTGNITTSENYWLTKYKYAVKVSSSVFSGGLYPISPKSVTEWYCPLKWGSSNTSSTVSSYTKAAISMSTVTGQKDRGIYTLNGVTYVAYNKAQYTLYCNDGGEMDIYFASGTGISISGNSSTSSALLSSVRVGITLTSPGATNKNLQTDFILKYAPLAESGKGNSKNASADTFLKVNGTSSVTTDSAVVTDLTLYCAYKSSDSYSFTPVNTENKLFTTDDRGYVVNVYVWLEGTDAQAVLGSSDISDGIKVNLNFVGVPVDE